MCLNVTWTEDGQGRAWPGEARRGEEQGVVRPGAARQGTAWRGQARHGGAWQGKEQGWAWRGTAWRG